MNINHTGDKITNDGYVGVSAWKKVNVPKEWML